LMDGSWRWSFAVLGLPLLATAILTAVLAPKPEPTGSASAPAASLKWWPDWSNKLIWQCGILFGSVNSSYFATNAFLPRHLAGAARLDLARAPGCHFGPRPRLLRVARRRRQAGAPGLAAHCLRRVDAHLPRRHRRHRRRLDGGVRGRARISRRLRAHHRFRVA